MKIKRIEIQAFKSYLHAKDSTFNFITSDNQVANFVSIYAPNGFGKTSFCDAVDYAITNKIHRYSRMRKLEVANKEELLSLNSTGEKQFLIRNKDAPKSLGTKVTVEVTGQCEKFESDYRQPRAGGADYKIDAPARAGTTFFENAMLYQEAIDGFLRESNSEIRFSKFSENDNELELITSKRTMLMAALRETDKYEKELLIKKQELSEQLSVIAEKINDFSIVNHHISILNSLTKSDNIKPLPIGAPFNLQQHQTYSQSLISVNAHIVNKLEGLSLVQSQITAHKSNIELYSRLYSQRKNINKKLNLLDDAVLAKSKVEEYEVSKKSYTEALSSNLDEYNLLTNIESLVSNYMDDYNKYYNIQRKKEETTKLCNKLKSEIAETKLSASKIKNKVFVSESQKSKHQLSIDNADSTYRKISEYESGISLLEKTAITIKDELISFDDKIKKFNDHIQRLQELDIHNKISIDTISFLDADSSNDILNLQDDFKRLNSLLLSNAADILAKNSTLQQTIAYQTEVKKLISTAHDIISKTKQSHCPVCSHPYEDFSKLENNIISNPVFSNHEKSLLVEISNLDNKAIEIKKHLADAVNSFTSKVSKEKSKINDYITIAENHRKRVKIRNDEAVTKIEQFKKELNDIKSSVSFLTQPEFIQAKIKIISDLENELAHDINEIRILETSLDKKSLEEYNLTLTLEKYGNDLTITEDLLLKYPLLTNFISKKKPNVISDESLRNILQEEKLKLTSLREYYENQIDISDKKINNVIKKISANLTLLSKTDLLKQKDTLTLQLNEINSNLVDVDQLLQKINLSADELICATNPKEIIENEAKLTASKIQNFYDAQHHIQVIDVLLENLVGIGSLEQVNADMESIKSKLIASQNIKKELADDIEKLGGYIKEKVDDFFKVDLINKIYQSIDPHPEYKNISFECNTDDKPKLLIKAESIDGSNSVSPILTFSSAQVNVLALSIFIARALHIKNNNDEAVDFIFIDDPVQSMDSINTLSLIDLFRTVTAKFNKQIIITTHDENFHELLKKKMPPNIFPARYLRLTSFGKVADDDIHIINHPS